VTQARGGQQIGQDRPDELHSSGLDISAALLALGTGTAAIAAPAAAMAPAVLSASTLVAVAAIE
jgi:hypothetical protein